MPFDAPRRRSCTPYTVPTGHPPPAQQVANQVRTATGYTLGRATPEGPRIAFLAPRGAPLSLAAVIRAGGGVAAQALDGAAPGEASAAASGAAPERLLARLRKIAALGDWLLPPMGALGRSVGLPDIRGLQSAFLALQRRGDIRLWSGTMKQYRGQRVVVLCASGAVLRTVDAPRGIMP
ncbi:MAG: hypothetical protein HIU82_02245 [Proteobacteria bacterium]|nr:hypothetical protein [Pseudomonadota bacterium]